jgi:hypothetical protein
MGFTSVGIGSTANYGFLQFFGTSNTLCWTANGTVGIGTPTPVALLDVNGSFRVLSSAYTALTSGTGVDIIYSGGGQITSGTRGVAGVLTTATMSYAASSHTFYTGASAGTTAVTINSSGQVGIGAGTIQAKFHIDNTTTTGLGALFYASGLTSGQNTSIGIGKAFSASNSGTILWNHVGDGLDTNYLGLGVFLADNKLNIRANGNVGIGITNPTTTLDVTGITRSAGLINTSPAHYIGYTTTNPTIFQFNGTNNTNGTVYSGVYNYVAFPTNLQTPAGFITPDGGKYTVAFSGIYAITFTTGTGTSNNLQLETFIAKNQYNNATDLNQPGTGTLASSYHPASTAQWSFSWTGYLSTTDFFTVGFFTSASTGTLSVRTTLSVALVQRTA